MTRIFRFASAALAGLFVALVAANHQAAYAADPNGVWLTEPGTSRIKIADCGGALCGTVVWIKDPIDPDTQKPRLDKLNADARKRGRPLMGVPIVLDMKPSGPDTWAGQVYNAEDGNTYSGSITMLPAGTLKLEGCALGGLVCRAQIWSRTN